MRAFVLLFLFTLGLSAAENPNIIYILADDLGYGDVQFNNPNSQIPTPHLNRMAEKGMKFTDFHTNSSVCSPTRYGILTGRYSFRTSKQRGALYAYDKALIAEDRMTVASYLRDNGYYTACIGKWHLGWDWSMKEKVDPTLNVKRFPGHKIDFTKEFKNGPLDCGFDSFFGLSASLDIPPFCYFRGNKAETLPTKEVPYRVFSNYRCGLGDPNLEPSQGMLDFNREIKTLIKNRKKIAGDKPLFVYYALPAPHWPVAPAEQFIGLGKVGPYGDYIYEIDWIVGEVYKALEEAGMADNTLVIFTSDNGASPYASGSSRRRGHKPNWPFSGAKTSILDGGHRIPCVVTWSKKIKGGSVNKDVFCTTDLLATCASIIGKSLPDNAGEDSITMLPAFEGRTIPQNRQGVIHHSGGGNFAIRDGKWKYMLVPGKSLKGKKRTAGYLYNMETDITESTNLYEQHPEIAQRLDQMLREIVANGRSTPGPKQENDVVVRVR